MRCVHVRLLSSLIFLRAAADQSSVADYNREVLQPLTKFRQQHRRTVDGRLCAAAFVQSRKAYTGCTDAANPIGESGRPWCYVEPQVALLEALSMSVLEPLRSFSMVDRLPGIIVVAYNQMLLVYDISLICLFLFAAPG